MINLKRPNLKWRLLKRLSCPNVLHLSFLLAITPAFAEQAPNLGKPIVVVPETIAGVEIVSAEEVINTLTSDNNDTILIDARIEKDRDYGYIEDSISLPDTNTNCDTLEEITADKNHHLMFFCNGIQCGRSVVSIKIARSCGYHHLSWFKGGFAEWKEKGYQYLKGK